MQMARVRLGSMLDLRFDRTQYLAGVWRKGQVGRDEEECPLR